MKAIRIAQTGGPEQLALVDVDPPTPGPGEVRVRHEAIGVNFLDTYHRGGLYPITLPSGIGVEAAGVIEAVGDGVTRFAVGDRIAYSSGALGAYAEAHVVQASRAVRVPEGVSLDVAAASLLKGLTAYYLLRKLFRVEQGHAVLVHAGAGGVGQILVQWAKHLGAFVIASVGSEAKASIPRALGADVVVDSSKENLVERVRAATNGEGVDVVYDGVGKDTFAASLDCLKVRGMFASYGNASGPVPPVDPLLLMQKGSLFFTRPTLSHYTRTPEELDEGAEALFDVIHKGAVKIAPPTAYALGDARKAHEDLEARRTTGSLILKP